MPIVKIEGKEITLPEDVVKAGVQAIRAVLAANGFPAIENAHIEIEGASAPGAPAIVNVTPRSTGKGSPDSGGPVPGGPDVASASPYDGFFQALSSARDYVNPAIALASRIERAESDGDTELAEQVLRSGQLERAVLEGADEGKRVWQALALFGHTVPISSKTVPEGF